MSDNIDVEPLDGVDFRNGVLGYITLVSVCNFACGCDYLVN